MDLGNLPEAEKELNAATSSGNAYVQPLARLALAGVQARENKMSEAEQNYRYLVDHPSDAVPKATAQLALAGLLKPTKPAEAEKIYKELEAKTTRIVGWEDAAHAREIIGECRERFARKNS